MRKLTIFVLVVLGALVLIGWRAEPTAANKTTWSGLGSVQGPYAFSGTIEDEETGANGPGGTPGTGQIAAIVGVLTFDGNGKLTGVISQNTRGCNVNCGYLQVSRVPIDGIYTLNPDGSATFDTCYRISGTNTWPAGLPPQNVHVIWEASFSLFFTHFRYLQTRLGDCSAGTDPSTWTLFPNPIPNISIGTADKV